MSSHTILLAEDDPFLRRAMDVALTKRGYRVLLAADGQQALDLLETETPDVMLLDLLMPRKTGIEVLQEVRKNPKTAGLRVLILSNSSKELEMHEAKSLGVSGYWIKANLSLQELSDRIQKVLAA
jgi:two-component system alkaline phosphatase synthesis response regulator PhoP